jgi:predicted nucleic acid-binding Zn finger protein
MSKPIHQVWTFRSDSNPDLEYQTLQYIGGATSCNCPGWTKRVAADGSRSCKHTRWIDLGTADRHCNATHNYQTDKPQIQINHDKQIKTTPPLGRRKFAV